MLKFTPFSTHVQISVLIAILVTMTGCRQTTGRPSTQPSYTPGGSVDPGSSWVPTGPASYVNVNGSNTSGDGSQEKPWATLSHACSRVTSAGEAIIVGAGTYHDSNQCVLAPGVSIKGAGRAQTTIISSLNAPYVQAVSNPVVDGNQFVSDFRLDGNNKALLNGINVTGRNHFTIKNIDFIRIKYKAISLQGTEWWTHAEQDYPAVPPPAYARGILVKDVTITGCSSNQFQAAVWVQSLEDAIFDNIVVDESAATGGQGNPMKSWPGWLKHCTIKNSIFTVNQNNLGVNPEPITLELWNIEQDTEIYNNTFNDGYISLVSGRKNGGTNALSFHDNRLNNSAPLGVAHELAVSYTDFYNNSIHTQSLGIWAATHMYNFDGITDIRVHHNVIRSTKGSNIQIQNGPGAVAFNNISVYNNVLDSTDGTWPNAGVLVSPNLNTNFSNISIQNNIFTNLGVGVYFYGGNSWRVQRPVVKYNDFWNVSKQVQNDGVTSPTISNNYSVDPLFMKTGARPNPYYLLQTSSPLINMGANVGLPYLGTAPDIGAYEMR